MEYTIEITPVDVEKLKQNRLAAIKAIRDICARQKDANGRTMVYQGSNDSMPSLGLKESKLLVDLLADNGERALVKMDKRFSQETKVYFLSALGLDIEYYGEEGANLTAYLAIEKLMQNAVDIGDKEAVDALWHALTLFKSRIKG